MRINFAEISERENLGDKIAKLYSEEYLLLLDTIRDESGFIYSFYNPSLKKCAFIKTDADIFQAQSAAGYYDSFSTLQKQLVNNGASVINYGNTDSVSDDIVEIPSYKPVGNGISYTLHTVNEKVTGIKACTSRSYTNNPCRTYGSLLFHLERIAPSLRVASSLLLARIFEDAHNIEVPVRAIQIRKILHSLIMVITHFRVFLNLAESLSTRVHAKKLFNHYFELCSLIGKYSGNRLFTDTVIMGGVRKDITDEWCGDAQKIINRTIGNILDINRKIINSRDFIEMTSGSGIIDKQNAISMGLTGVSLRASGIDIEETGTGFNTLLGEKGSTLDRFIIRLNDAKTMCNNIITMIANLSRDKKINSGRHEKEFINEHDSVEGQINNFMLALYPPSLPEGYYYDFIETANGLTTMLLKSANNPTPELLYVRAPSKTNISALQKVIGMNIKELEYHLLSISISGKEINSPLIRGGGDV
ncbi:MAG: hypothetical protein JXA66_04450 [Oligoflexia bacterium]|nr:hypothetical protein [Oligoflexia bacterium]